MSSKGEEQWKRNITKSDHRMGEGGLGGRGGGAAAGGGGGRWGWGWGWV